MASQALLIPDPPLELQRDVQRKLGRCLVRLQQYEILLKAMVAHGDIEGPPEQLQALQAEKIASAKKKTMGTLVGLLTENYLTAGGVEEDGDDESPGNGGMWVRHRFQMSLDAERYEAVKTDLKELVDLRNELVHHFLERFNIWEEEGCTAADAFLEESYETIDGHYLTLREWARGMDNARTMMASFMETTAFKDMFFDGIQPDGSVHWPGCGIVNQLREAEAELAQEGWTPLLAAIAWIGSRAPEQIPKRYGCGSWRHVIHESRQFEIRKQGQSENGGTVVWYRSRLEETPVQQEQIS